MACRSCGGRAIKRTTINNNLAPQSSLMAFKDSDFKTAYYIGAANVPIKGSFTNIDYGLRDFGSKMLLHVNDFNDESFTYDEPQMPEAQPIAQVFAKKSRRKIINESETDI